MNIFQKDCPECASPNPVDAVSCRCGYCFDPEALAATHSNEYAQQQDRLYCDYLAARIAQAEAEFIVARERANAEPGNTYKASEALLAEQALNALQAEMKQLSLRIPSARPSSSTRRIAPPMKPTPPKTPVAPSRLAVTTRAPAPRAGTAPVTPSPRNEPARSKTAAPWPAVVNTKPIETKPKAAPAVQTTPPKPKPAPGIKRKSAVAPAPRAATPKPTPAPVVPINGQHRAASPSVTTKPTENFRRLQARKAEAIARSQEATTTKPAEPTTPPLAERPPADIPPLVAIAKQTTQECPNCTATVAADRTRCTCGYALSRAGEEVPALSLDAGALAILTDGISVNPSNRRR